MFQEQDKVVETKLKYYITNRIDETIKKYTLDLETRNIEHE